MRRNTRVSCQPAKPLYCRCLASVNRSSPAPSGMTSMCSLNRYTAACQPTHHHYVAHQSPIIPPMNKQQLPPYMVASRERAALSPANTVTLYILGKTSCGPSMSVVLSAHLSPLPASLQQQTCLIYYPYTAHFETLKHTGFPTTEKYGNHMP